MSMRVFVQQDGVVIHAHGGTKGGLHGPWSKHEDASLHAETPANFADLTAAQLKQYAAALAGKNFSFMWVKGTAARKAKVVEAGNTWNYGKREAAKAELPQYGTDEYSAGFTA